mmetsp:Transcript_73015/g.205694  ORF Transcript_73015/g.205694 Transcript_73015/m.205694 type:complete len:181 (-) Transcript_73015:372-914(-)
MVPLHVSYPGQTTSRGTSCIAAAHCTLWHTSGLCAAITMSSHPSTWSPPGTTIEELGEDMGREEHELKQDHRCCPMHSLAHPRPLRSEHHGRTWRADQPCLQPRGPASAHSHTLRTLLAFHPAPAWWSPLGSSRQELGEDKGRREHEEKQEEKHKTHSAEGLALRSSNGRAHSQGQRSEA